MTTGFTIAAATAVLLAIGFAVAPLLVRRENDNSSWGPILILAFAILIPASAVFTYQVVGTPEGIAPDESEAGQIRASLIELARAVERHPEEAENWVRMGLAYKELQEYSSAEHALRRALYIDGDSPFVRVELAETLLFDSGQAQLPEEAGQLLRQALQTNPGNQKALWLLGLDAFQRGEHRRSVAILERLEGLLPEGNARNTVQEYLAQARSHAGVGPSAAPEIAEEPPVTEPDADSATLTISVSLDESLQERVRGHETVFVIVRPAEGPRMPLAVQRLTTGDLPARVQFDASDSMMGDATIADAEAVTVTARVSHAGQATAQEGDFEGHSETLTVSGPVHADIRIDQIL